MATSFRWDIPVDAQLIPGLTSYEARIRTGLMALADLFAAQMQAQAQSGAPWQDRSGAARQGLRGFAVKEATRIIVYLVHSVQYGVYLELGTSRMSPRPIVLPVLERTYGPLMSAVRALVAG